MTETFVPHKMSNGDFDFGDWRAVRKAIEQSYVAMGKQVPSSIPREDWNLVGLAIAAHAFNTRCPCAGLRCEKKLYAHEVIRCLDCKAPLCEDCAPGHFWPNGRPK